jgi:DNA-binding transcriptional LysR family regulator
MSSVRNLDLVMLRAFATVADRGSMTRAAETLNLTQGAVSQQIRRLEDQLGAELFHRHDKGVRLTRAGEDLLSPVRRLLAGHDELCADLFGGRVEGRVRLGVPYDLAAAVVGPVLKPFAEAHPRVELSLVCGASPELLDGLARRRLDLALVEESLEASGGERLRVERMVWVGAPGGLAPARRPIPLATVAERCAFRTAMSEALATAGLSAVTVFDNAGLEASLAAVRADLAVTAWLASLAPSDLLVLGPASGLPELPAVAINLRLAPGDVPRAAAELARQIRSRMPAV